MKYLEIFLYYYYYYLDLQNDLKELLGKIEEGLYKIHADEKIKKSDQKTEIIQQTTDISIKSKYFFCYIYIYIIF